MAGLAIYLLGVPSIELNELPVELDTRKAVALLAYLATTGKRHSRDALATMLWSEYDQQRSRAALRRTLSVLKSAVGGFGLKIERESLGLDPEADVWLDLYAFRSRIAECSKETEITAASCLACQEPLLEASKLYRDDFMAGFTLRDSPSFDEWQYFQQEALRRELATVLSTLVGCLTITGEYEAGLEHSLRWLAQDNLHEPAHRQVMQLYTLAGRRSAALRQYRQCVRLLEEELGVPPLEETTALYERILSGELTVASPPNANESAPNQPPSSKQVVSLPVSSSSLPLVGRKEEWARLSTAYNAIQTDGQMIAITGEAGIGKTRLAQSFLQNLDEQDIRIITVRCYEGESKLAYGPLADGLRDAIEKAHPKEWWQRVPVHWLGEASRLLPELADLGSEVVPPPASDSPGAQSRFFEGLSTIILALTANNRPGAMMIDDLHWADEATVDFLSYFIRRMQGRPVLVLTTWRNDTTYGSQRLDPMLADAYGQGLAERIQLRRLDESDLRELLNLSGRSVGDRGYLARRLYQESEGLPFFVSEYLNLLGQKSVTGQESNLLTSEASWPLPGDARNLLHSRIIGVGEASRQLLSTAAVIGRSFDFETLRIASGRSEEETISGLEQLTFQGLIVEQPRDEKLSYALGPEQSVANRPEMSADRGLNTGTGPTYDFNHAKLRTLVYEETSLARLRLLHRRVAEAMADASSSSRAAQIAYHYQLAGLDLEAAKYNKIAGDDSRSLYANSEALVHYQSALALGHTEIAYLHESIADLLTLQGDYDSALASYEMAAAVNERLGKAAQFSRLEHKLGSVYHRRGEYDLAMRQFEAALQDSAGPAERSYLVADWSLAAHHSGDSDLAFRLANESLELAEEAKDGKALAQVHNILGILATSRGDTSAARNHLENSLRLAETLDEPGFQVAALNNLSRAAKEGGEIERALSLAETALVLCQELGDRHREAALQNNLADLLHAAGHSEQAMDHLKQAVTIYAEVGGQADEWRPEIWKLAEW
jgi:predicted ATPase/DNA-binding SARP family transcriptional activator